MLVCFIAICSETAAPHKLSNSFAVEFVKFYVRQAWYLVSPTETTIFDLVSPTETIIFDLVCHGFSQRAKVKGDVNLYSLGAILFGCRFERTSV